MASAKKEEAPKQDEKSKEKMTSVLGDVEKSHQLKHVKATVDSSSAARVGVDMAIKSTKKKPLKSVDEKDKPAPTPTKAVKDAFLEDQKEKKDKK